jgi:RNA polymerase sigma-70 factor (ECF subfamily)
MNPQAMSLFLSRELSLGQNPQAAAKILPLRELTLAIRRGEEQAFNRFYECYRLRLYKYLMALAHGNETEAREVLQTVILKLARKLPIFDEEAQLWGWLSRVARNAFLDYCRSHRKDRGTVSLEEIKSELIESQSVEHRLAASVRQALEQITPEESEMLRAAYVDERPLQELADESGQTYKAIESRLARLREKLKKILLRNLRHEERFQAH